MIGHYDCEVVQDNSQSLGVYNSPAAALEFYEHRIF